MGDAAVARAAGALAVLAGVVLCVYAVAESLQPVGCIGDTCDFRPMRETPTIVSVLFGLGGALLVAAALALGLLLRRRGLLGRVGTVGCGLLVLGVATMVAGAIFAQVFPGPAEDLMPAFVLPGLGLPVLGLLLVAIAVFRARLLPAWSVVLLAVGLVVMLFYNEENWRVLLAIPFAVALAVAGAVMLRPATARVVEPAA